MITTETPYKLAEIIRETWPGLYKKHQNDYDKSSINTLQNSTKKL
jgi:hypothetical protein